MTAVALPRPRSGARVLRTPLPELAGLLALAAVLDLWALSRNGWANDYYAAAVRSMSTSWHAFLYGSFDPSGVMTVDKPPLALWVQALSVRIFGLHPLAILVPEAVMGIATVGLTYDLVRRRFGRFAGFVGGLALALTPITVAISRHNNPDALLVVCCVGALWCLVRALEDGRTRWLVLCGACVGLGFEAKMGAALLVVPALASAYLWVAPRGRLAAVRQLVAGGAALGAVGGAWPLLVALTPAADRPWISGTGDNSILSLILDYNGLGRLDGQAGGPGGGGAAGPLSGGGGPFGGGAGVLRLFNSALGGQVGWLLGLAVVGGGGLLVASRLRRADARTGWLVATGGTFLTCAAAFSFARGIFHPYYVSELAPFSAALVGAGAGETARGELRARVLAPLAIAAGVLSEVLVIHNGAADMRWIVPLLVVAGVVAAFVLASPMPRRLRVAAVSVALGALLIAPASWAFDTLGHATSSTFPAGGPQGAAFGGAGFAGGGPPAGGGTFGGGTSALSSAVAYANGHGGGTIAVSSQSGASASIIRSGARVAGIGGFSGRESDVTVAWLKQEIREGRIRWVLATGNGFGGGFGGDSRTGAQTAMSWVEQNCRAVSSVSGLYDCSGAAWSRGTADSLAVTSNG